MTYQEALAALDRADRVVTVARCLYQDKPYHYNLHRARRDREAALAELVRASDPDVWSKFW